MKPFLSNLKGRACAPRAAVMIALMVLPQARGAITTWTGATDLLWATGANWSLGAEPVDTDDVVFAGAGVGAITLVAGDLASSLQFSANGYSLTGTGATLALTSGNITVDPGISATIGVALAGTGAVNKLGDGTLVINTTATNTGGWNIQAGEVQIGNVNIGSATASTITIASGATLRTTTGTNAISDTSTLQIDAGGLFLFNQNNTETVRSLEGAGLFDRTDGGTTARNFTINNSVADATWAGVIAGSSLATGANVINVVKSGTNTLTFTNANTYGGTTTINTGTLRLTGGGALVNSNTVVVGSSDSRLELGSLADVLFAMDRIGDANQIELQDAGEVVFFGANDTVNITTETFGSLETNSGHNVVTLNPVTGGQMEVTTGSLVRSNKGTLLFRAVGLGQAAGADTARLLVTTAPTGASFIGGGGLPGSTNISIIPWAIANGTSVTGSGESFVTYDATTGIRPLAIGEYATAVTEGSILNDNVLLSGATSVAYRAGVNALRMDTGASLTLQNGRLFEITSGTFLDNSAAGVTISGGTLEFGTSEAIFYLAGATPAAPITTTITSGMRNTGANAGLTLTASNNDSELVLAGASAITGEISINRGILRLDSDQALNPFSLNNLRFAAQGNTATARLRLNETDVFMGSVLAQNFGFVSNGGAADAIFGVTQTADVDSNIVLQDTITASTGKLNLVKAGASRLGFVQDSTFTGTATVQAGLLRISGGADWDSAGGVIIEGGTFAVLNTSGGSTNTNRLPDAMDVTFRGGEFLFDDNNSAGVNYSERVGAMVLESGVNVVSNDYQTSGTNTSVLFFNEGNNFANSLVRTQGAVVRFRAIDGTLGINTKGRIQIGPSNATNPAGQLLKNGILAEGGVGGFAVVGDDWATISADLVAGGNFDTSVTALTTYQTSAVPADWAATDNVKLSTPGTVALSSVATVNSLILGDQVDLNLGGSQLIVDAGGILALSTTTAKTIGNGSLTGGAFAASEIVLRTASDAGTGQAVTVGADIVNNGVNATSFTKWGAANLILSGANSFSGSLNITQGTVVADGVARLGAGAGRILRLATSTTLDLSSSAASEVLPFTSILATGIGQGTITGPNGQMTTFNGTLGGIGDLRFNNSFAITLTAELATRDALAFGGSSTTPLAAANPVSTVALAGGANVIGGALQVGLNQREAELTLTSGSLRVGFSQFQPDLNIGYRTTDSTTTTPITRGLVDLTGTTSFEAQVMNLRVGVTTGGNTGGAGTTTEGDLIIGQDSNLLVGNEILVADSSGLGQQGVTSSITFGSGTNTVRAPTFVVGGRKSTGQVIIAPGGTLTLNGVTGATMNLHIGDQRNTDTGTVASGVFDMTGGTLVARLENLEIGDKDRSTGNGNIGGAFGTFTTGSSAGNDISAINVVIGRMQRGTGTSTAISIGQGTLNMGGGVFDVFGDVVMGDWSDNAGTNGTARGELNITGGVFTVAGNIVKTDDDRSAAMILVDGGTLDGQHQASADSTMAAITASQLIWRAGSLVDIASLTLDGRGVTDGVTFGALDTALILRDNTVAFPLSLTNAEEGKGGIQYEAAGGGAGAVISGTLDLGSRQRGFIIEDSGSAVHDLVVSGDITGTGSAGIDKSGAGTLLLSGTNTYSGATSVREGTLVAPGGVTNRLPAGTPVTLGGGTTSGLLQLGNASGELMQTIGDLATSGTGSSNAVVGGHSNLGTLTVNQTGTSVFSGNLGGVEPNQNNLHLVKTGAGDLTLAGSNSLAGTVVVNAGILSVSGSGRLGTGVQSVSVADGAAFNLRHGGTIQQFAGTGNVVTLGSSTGALLGFTIDGAGNDRINLIAGQTLTRSGITTTDIYVGAAPTLSQYVLINSPADGSFLGSGSFVLGTIFNGGSFVYDVVRESVSSDPDQLLLTVTAQAAPPDVWWLGDLGGTGTGVWNASAIGGNTNWATSSAGTTDAGVPPDAGSHVHFSATGASNFATTLGADMVVKQVTFESGSVGNVVSVAAGNMLTLAGTGGVGFTMASGNAGTISFAPAVVLGAAQTWNVEDAAGVLQLSGGISGTGPLTLNGSGTAAGTFVLDGASSTYSGATTVLAGRLVLEGSNRLPASTALTLGGAASTAVLQLGTVTASADTMIGDLISGAASGSAIVGGNAVLSTLSITQTASGTYSGALGGAGVNENQLALVKAGAGTLVLDGTTLTYAGTTEVRNGTLQLGSSAVFAATGAVSVIAEDAATASFDVNGKSISLTGTLTLAGAGSTAQPQFIDSSGSPGLVTLGGGVIFDATNDPLGGLISASLDAGAAARTITVGDSANAVTDLIISGALTSVHATNVGYVVAGAGDVLFAGPVSIGNATADASSRDFSMNGTGVLTITNAFNAGDDIAANDGTIIVEGSGALFRNFGDDLIVGNDADALLAVVRLNVAAAFGGDDIFIRGGSSVLLGANGALVDAAGTAGMDDLLIEDDATKTVADAILDVQGFDGNGFDNLTLGVVNNAGVPIGGMILNTGGSRSNLLSGSADYTLRHGTIAANLGGSSTLTKTTQGVITLSGNNSYSGTTTISGGIILDYTTNAGAGEQRLSSSTLNLGGTTSRDENPLITMNGHATNEQTETVGDISARRGAAMIDLNSNGAALNLAAGALSRVNGTLNLDLPTSGSVTTTTPDTAFLGAWATVNRNQFAAITGGVITAVPTVAKEDVTTWRAGDDVINFSAYTGSITDCNILNSLTFDAAVSSTVQVAKTLVLSSGGLMVTGNVGANGSSITGGTLLVPDSGGLVVHQHNADALGILEISSRVIAAALSKSGNGELVLSGAGNVLGAVFVNEGVLRLAGGSALSDTAPVNIMADDTAALELTAGHTETIGRLEGGLDSRGRLIIGAGATLTIQQTDGDTTLLEGLVFGGDISGAGTLVKSGDDALILEGDSSLTGAVIVNGGRLQLQNRFGKLDNASSFTLISAELNLDQDTNVGTIDRVGNAAGITLHSTAGTRGLWLSSNQDATRNENVGLITLGFGDNRIQVDTSGGTSTSRIVQLQADNLSRGTGHGTALIVGQLLGNTANARAQFLLDSDPSGASAAVGGGGAAGSTSISIYPWLVGESTANNDTNLFDNYGNSFVMDASAATSAPRANLRVLTIAEYVTDEAAFNALGGVSTDNVRFATNPATALTSTATAINSLVLDSATGITLTGPASGLAITSGALLAAGTGAHTIDGFAALTTGASRDYILYVTNPAGSLTVNSPLTSAVPLVKSGAGTLILGAAGSAFTEVYLNFGTLQIDATDKIGATTPVRFAGGTLRVAPGFTDDLGGRTFTLNTGGGTIDTNGVNVTATGLLLAGADSLTKSGTGTLTLAGSTATTQTGAVILRQGNLVLGQDAGINAVGTGGVSVLANAATGAVVLSNAANEQIDNTARVTLVNAGSNATANWDLAGFTETVGGLDLTVVSNSGNGSKILLNGGTLIVNGDITFNNNRAATGNTATYLEITGNNSPGSAGTLDLGGGIRTITVQTNQTGTANEPGSDAGIEVAVTNGGIVKEGARTLFLSGANTYAGSTIINQGTISISSSAGLGADAPGNTLTLRDGATLQSTGASVTLGASQNVILDGTGATVDTAGGATGTLEFTAVVSGHDCAPLTKTGAGQLVLSAANTYAGGTTVAAGTLVVANATGSATGSGSLTMAAGTTLAGNGLITAAAGNAITLGGSLNPGLPGSSASGLVSLAVSGAGTLSFGGVTLDLLANTGDNPAASNDRVMVLASDWSNVLFNGPLDVVTALDTASWVNGDRWQIFDWSGIASGTAPAVGSGGFATINLPSLSGGLFWDLDGLYSSGYIAITNVPEPSRALLLLLGLLGLMLRRRRK